MEFSKDLSPRLVQKYPRALWAARPLLQMGRQPEGGWLAKKQQPEAEHYSRLRLVIYVLSRCCSIQKSVKQMSDQFKDTCAILIGYRCIKKTANSKKLEFIHCFYLLCFYTASRAELFFLVYGHSIARLWSHIRHKKLRFKFLDSKIGREYNAEHQLLFQEPALPAKWIRQRTFEQKREDKWLPSTEPPVISPNVSSVRLQDSPGTENWKAKRSLFRRRLFRSCSS